MNPLLLIPALVAAPPVYEGQVHAPGQDGGPLFTYERRVRLTDEGLEAAHVTRDAAGRTVVIEAARLTPAYALRRFEVDQRQQGFRGSVTVSDDGRRLHYELQHDDGTRRTADEGIDAPAVAGPSLHGFIQRGDALLAGRALRVRMPVLERRASYGFVIRRHAVAPDGAQAFSVTPTNWLLRLALAPLQVTFDARTRQVLRYDGRVPPLHVVDGRARPLDAHVTYTARAPAYR